MEKAIETLRQRVNSFLEFEFISGLINQFPRIRIVLVGGVVRDAILGVASKDYDFLIEGLNPEEIGSFLRGEIGGKRYGGVVEVESLSFGVLKFRPEGSKLILDLAVPRQEKADEQGRSSGTRVWTKNVSIEEDLSRRDVTINAIGLDLKDGSLIDPFGGLGDINNKIIRAVGEPQKRFLEDPTRILRVIRFAVKFNFQIERETWQAMKEVKGEIGRLVIDASGREVARVPAERVGQEFLKAFEIDPTKTLELYNELDLLRQFFPEVVATKGVAQPPQFHSEGDVYTHTLLALAKLPRHSSAVLKLATLLHDIGKADTFRSAAETGDRIRFNLHDHVGAEKSAALLRRLKFENKITDGVKWLVGNHMILLTNFPKMRPSKQKTLARHELFPDLIELAKADIGASLRSDGRNDIGGLSLAERVFDVVQQEKREGKPVEIISGNDLIPIIQEVKKRAYNTKTDGRLVGEIKKRVNEEYQDSKIKTKEEAIVLARRLINTNKSRENI